MPPLLSVFEAMAGSNPAIPTGFVCFDTSKRHSSDNYSAIVTNILGLADRIKEELTEIAFQTCCP